MAATQTPYCSYQDLKAYLNITDNSQDAFLQLIISRTMGFIDRFTKRTFGYGNPDDPTDLTAFLAISDTPGTVAGELYDGFPGSLIYLNQTDIVSIDSVEFGSSAQNIWNPLSSAEFVWRDDGRLIFGGNYFNSYDSEAYGEDDGNFSFVDATSGGYQTIRVNYHYGYFGVPPEISLACLDICAALYILRKNLGVKQERVGDWEITYQANVRAELKNQPDTLGTLEIFRKRNVGVA
jgi:hypothetical protein